jgi:putative redox protein
MKTKIDCAWLENMSFEATVDNYKLIMDADPSVGGQNKGPRPKPLLLVALAGCSGMDVVSILAKMKVKIDSFRMEAEGEMTDEHPKYYKSFHVVYYFKGEALDPDKLKKAVELSQDKYCGVSAQFKMGVPVTFEIVQEK